jgi:hypothetical protein
MAMATDLNENNIKNFFHKKNWNENLNVTGKEIVYDFSINSDLKIRVYTSISKTSGMRREKGKDAIRTFLFNIKENKPKSQSMKVYRTENWKTNLQNKIMELYNKGKNV